MSAATFTGCVSVLLREELELDGVVEFGEEGEIGDFNVPFGDTAPEPGAGGERGGT